MRRVLVLFAALVVIFNVAHPDVVYLNNGGIVVGEVAERTDEYVVVTNKGVKTILQTHEIERIEFGTLDEIYWRKLKAISKDDAEAHFQLGLWCERLKLSDYAREEFEKCVILNPNHIEARKKLGYKFTNEEGWVKEGETFPKEERIKPSEKMNGKQSDLVKRILEGSLDLANLRGSEREEAIRALEVAATSEKEHIKALQKEIINRSGIESADTTEQMLKRWQDLWEEARLIALKEVYLGKEETKRFSSTERALEVFRYYAILLKRKIKAVKGMSAESAKDLVSRFMESVQRSDKIRAALAKVNGNTTAPCEQEVEDSFAAAYGLILYKAGFREEGWKVAQKSNGWRFRVFLMFVADTILSNNKDVMKQLSTDEQALCERINDYRMALGRMPLEVDLRLCNAARSHAAEMEKLGYFGHISPVKERMSPKSRAALVAYNADLVGENLFKGKDSTEAVDAWRQSVEHHRQLLAGWDTLLVKDEKEMLPLIFMPWRTVGVGCQNYTVVMFGPLSLLKGGVPELDEKKFQHRCGSSNR